MGSRARVLGEVDVGDFAAVLNEVVPHLRAAVPERRGRGGDQAQAGSRGKEWRTTCAETCWARFCLRRANG